MHAGKQVVDWLYRDQLQVDAEWSVRRPEGFTWWPHRHAQRIDVVREVAGPNGDVGHIVRIETDFARGVDLAKAPELLDIYMSTATLCGFVYDEQKRTLTLSSALRVHGGTWRWMAGLLSVTAMVQATEAHFFGHQIGQALGGSSATSNHPTSGQREEPDVLVSSFPKVVTAEGQKPSRWTEPEFDAALRDYMQRPPSLLATGGGRGATAEFRYGGFSSLLRMAGDAAHPRLGNGLMLLHSFPVAHLGKSPASLRQLALSLNKTELGDNPIGYGLGSYCQRDDCIHFTGFVPNVAYADGLLPNFYYQSAARGAQLEAQFQATGTPKAGSSPAKETDSASGIAALLRTLLGRKRP